MRYLRLFENREEISKLEMFKIHRICRGVGIKNYIINPDGSVDVSGSVSLDFWMKNSTFLGSGLRRLPFRFRRVTGYFNCTNNNLTTLEGVPNYIGGNFRCNNNNLTDLEHFPEYVTGHVYIYNNPIYSMVQYFIGREDRHKIIELFNFSGVIQEGSRVILNRLEYVFEAYDIEITDRMLREIAEHYKIIGR